MLLFSYSDMSDSLQPYGLQHARHPFLSPSPEVAQLKNKFLLSKENFVNLHSQWLVL